MVNPPKRGDASYNSYNQEKRDLIASLQRRARRITDAFNSLEGVVCQETEGAMYCFPRISIPLAAIEAVLQQSDGLPPALLLRARLLAQF